MGIQERLCGGGADRGRGEEPGFRVRLLLQSRGLGPVSSSVWVAAASEGCSEGDMAS